MHMFNYPLLGSLHFGFQFLHACVQSDSITAASFLRVVEGETEKVEGFLRSYPWRTSGTDFALEKNPIFFNFSAK